MERTFFVGKVNAVAARLKREAELYKDYTLEAYLRDRRREERAKLAIISATDIKGERRGRQR